MLIIKIVITRYNDGSGLTNQLVPHKQADKVVAKIVQKKIHDANYAPYFQ
jgi:hypothetical protein